MQNFFPAVSYGNCDSSCKPVSQLYVFTACQMRFHTEAAESIGKINKLLKDLSFTATSTCHFSYQFDCSLTPKGSTLLKGYITHMSLTPLFMGVYM